MPDAGSLLLVTHVHVRQGPNGLQIDAQTAAGIEQWCRHFDRVTFYGMMLEGQGTGASSAWVDVNKGLIGARSTIHGLPFAYDLRRMARHVRDVRAELRGAIAAHRHLCFTLGSLVGDWPALAAWEAIRQRRRYAAWIDRVEPSIIRNRLAGFPLKRLAAELALPVAQTATRYLLRRSAVALLQGGDTFDYYARSAPDPHCTYDTHTSVGEQIGREALARKQARVLTGAPLDIVYVGRAVAMKGPFDWLETLAQLQHRRIAFRATWIGDGPDLPAIRQRALQMGVADLVAFPGFETRHDVLLDRLKQSDLLLFCHKTPESARCLIEALVCGCPILGYDSAYPRGLTGERGGGVFAPPNDVAALAGCIVALHESRADLAQLITAAAASGELYNEDAVYAHRAALMRRG